MSIPITLAPNARLCYETLESGKVSTVKELQNGTEVGINSRRA